MKQTLTQRVERLEELTTQLVLNGTTHSNCIKEITRILDQPYTAMRSTGIEMDYLVCRPGGLVKPIEPQEDVREKIADYLWTKMEYGRVPREYVLEIADKILAIVKGE